MKLYIENWLTSIQNGKCLMWTDAASLDHLIYIGFLAAILPTGLMIIFSLLAYKNIRNMIGNIHPQRSHRQIPEKIRLQKRDRQLSKMVFVQIIVYMIFTIAYSIQTVYDEARLIIGGTKSSERSAIENFVLFITFAFLFNFYSAASFFCFSYFECFSKRTSTSFYRYSISIYCYLSLTTTKIYTYIVLKMTPLFIQTKNNLDEFFFLYRCCPYAIYII